MDSANTALPFFWCQRLLLSSDRGTEVGTYVWCVWNTPRNQSTPMEVDIFNDIRNDTRTPKMSPLFTPTIN